MSYHASRVDFPHEKLAEEEIYLPLLEARLHPEEVDRMVESMEKTVNEAKSSLKAIATGE